MREPQEEKKREGEEVGTRGFPLDGPFKTVKVVGRADVICQHMRRHIWNVHMEKGIKVRD